MMEVKRPRLLALEIFKAFTVQLLLRTSLKKMKIQFQRSTI